MRSESGQPPPPETSSCFQLLIIGSTFVNTTGPADDLDLGNPIPFPSHFPETIHFAHPSASGPLPAKPPRREVRSEPSAPDLDQDGSGVAARPDSDAVSNKTR
jgi:hypothetical protein